MNDRMTAQEMLDNIKPFEVWVDSIDPEIKAWCEKHYGSLRECYEKFANALRELKRTEEI